MGVNVVFAFVVFHLATQAIGVPAVAPSKEPSEENSINKRKNLSIDMLKLPKPVLNGWPRGGSFASKIIDLGGLQVYEASTFTKLWSTYSGGPDNLFGWILVAKDVSKNTTNPTLKQPLNYTLVWNSASITIHQDGPIYIWLPTAPNGYKAVGHVVTTTPNKPSLDKIRCVRSDLTDQSESYSLIWRSGEFYVYDVRPKNRGVKAPSVRVGTFVAQLGTPKPPSIMCLKNTNAIPKYMPNLEQIKAILQVYSPVMSLHPDEKYFPSSVEWFFSNGALLYKKGNESKPISISPNGSNLPQDPNNDGAYWVDLPADANNRERVKKGDLKSAKGYVHVKPMLGGTFTDIVIWVFYPFNGPASAKVEFFTIPLGKIGEHIGDWEHVTLRLSNFNGELKHMYFSRHNRGEWLDASQIEFQNGNKPLYYSSMYGHASYPHVGLNMHNEETHGIRNDNAIIDHNLLGVDKIGIRNDTGQSGNLLDLGAYQLISAEYLGSLVKEPPWLNYFRKWGPKIDYGIDNELQKIGKYLPMMLKSILKNILKSLPSEMLAEEGPLGPKKKDNWNGDERS